MSALERLELARARADEAAARVRREVLERELARLSEAPDPPAQAAVLPADVDEPLWTTAQVAEHAKVSEKRVREAVKRGTLIASPVGGRHLRFVADAARAWACGESSNITRLGAGRRA